MNTKTWVIPQDGLITAPSKDGLIDVVVCVNAYRVATDGNYSAQTPISMGCATPSETDFTAYNDLTFDQVCGWLDAGTNLEEIDANLDVQIEELKNPPTLVLPTPWG